MCAIILPLVVAPLSAAEAASVFGDLEVVHATDALQAGRAQESLAIFESLLQRGGPASLDAEARFVAAIAALTAENPALAIELLDGVDGQLPEILDVVADLRAKVHRARGDWKAARVEWARALAVPDSARELEARFGIADAAFALGELDAARRAYSEALGIFGRTEQGLAATYNLGRISELKGKWEDAAEQYRRLAYRYPDHPLHDVAEARLAHLATTGRAPPPTLSEELSRVDRFLASRSIEDAAAALAAILPRVKSYGERLALQYRQAQLAYRQQEYGTAISLFSRLARGSTDPWRLNYESWLARTYSASGDFDAAVRIHLKIAEEAVTATAASEALFKGAWLAYNGGDHARAMKLFGQFIKAYPDDAAMVDAMWFYAWNAYRLGDLDAARKSFQELGRRFPASSLVDRCHYWEGRVEARMGNMSAARSAYTKAHEVAPLTYYGALAAQRLRELDELAGVDHEPILLASIDRDALPAGIFEPVLERPASLQRWRAVRAPHMPWPAMAFDWSNPAGRRAVRLIRLGFTHEAAAVVEQMEPVSGLDADANDVQYARAHLLQSLGAYNRAYGIASRNFGSALRGPLDAKSRRFFHLAYPAAFTELVNRAADEFGLPPLLLLSLMRQESAFNDRARSVASANGLLQIIPRTGAKIAARLGVSDYNFGVLQDPSVNVRFGAWYLAQLFAKFGGNPALAIGGYNAGPVAMQSWVDLRKESSTDEFVEDIPFRETRHYVKRVLGNYAVYQALYGDAPLTLPDDVPDSYGDNVNF